MRKFGIVLALTSLCIAIVSCDFSAKKDPSNIAVNKPVEIQQINDPITVDGITIQSPTEVENLSFFILTGTEKLPEITYRTLSKAMEAKEVVVKETGTVNELSIDNNSDEYIFIHSGDIVKGGKQDRTISYDVIIPPRSKNVSLASFCVESGRWQKRGGETEQSFASNTKMLSSRDLKLAARYEKNQSKVWSKVAEQKDRLNKNVSAKNGYAVNVGNNESDTSLQLALESEELVKVREKLNTQLKDLIDTPNAIGYAYAINGEMYGVEVYNNQQLFKDLWDKILESVIVEAISKQDEEMKASRTTQDVLAFMEAVKENDQKEVKRINNTTQFKTAENKAGNIIFSTEDMDKKTWVHKSYMKADATERASSKLNNGTPRQYRNN